MANRTAWTPGNNSTFGAGYANLFNSSDLQSLAVGAAVLSGIATIDNTSSLDQYMDVSVELAIASTAVPAGASLLLWRADVQEDGSTIGDGLLSPSTQTASFTPAWTPLPAITFYASTRTTLIGNITGIVIPPRKFRFIAQNNAVALSSGTQTVSAQTYNIALNN